MSGGDPRPAPEAESRGAFASDDRPVQEVVLASLLIGVWALVWWSTAQFPASAAGYVRFLLVGLISFSAAHLLTAAVRMLRARRRARGRPRARGVSPPERTRPWLVAAFLGSTCLYVLLIPWLGMLTATAAFGLPWLGRAVSWNWRALVGAALLITALYLLAAVVLGIRMPDGLLI